MEVEWTFVWGFDGDGLGLDTSERWLEVGLGEGSTCLAV